MSRSDLVPAAGTTADVAVRRATLRLGEAGVNGAGRDARLLVAAAMGMDQNNLILRPDTPLEPAAAAKLAAMLERRARLEPVSRILGERDFYGRSFIVTPDTLDPRPDSETLITATLEIVAEEGWRRTPLRLIDIGTGSGCLLLTLLAELPLARGLGTDASVAALDVARRNAECLGLTARAEFRPRRWLEGACDTFDILVCNPPYIPTRDIAGLAADVRDYDPMLALDGGPDGLGMYREIAPRLGQVVPAGWAIFEVGAGQAGPVSSILERNEQGRSAKVRSWRDLGGHERCVAVATHR